MRTFVIGSRGSPLALWQARWVAERLTEAGFAVEIDVIKTSGDRIRDTPLAQVGAASGAKGVFTKEIEEALEAGSIDLAVHSLKDLPTALPEGLALGAVPERADPRDAFVGRRLADLPAGARVGTSSLRRAAQLRALRPDLAILDIRGNVDTRLRKLDEGQFDAILLACAGLRRLGLDERIAEALDAATMAPAVGQGALGVEIRDDDPETRAAVERLDHRPSRRAAAAERSLLQALGGGCQVPLGALAEEIDERLRLRAAVAAPDGTSLVRSELDGPLDQAEALGRRVAEDLLARGAAELIAAAEAVEPKR